MMNSNVKVLQNSEISNGIGGGLFRIVTKLSNLVFGPIKKKYQVFAPIKLLCIQF
jgi:hypothetical protein